VFVGALAVPARADEAALVKILRELDANVAKPSTAETKALRDMLAKNVRSRRDMANRRESVAWDAIKRKRTGRNTAMCG